MELQGLLNKVYDEENRALRMSDPHGTLVQPTAVAQVTGWAVQVEGALIQAALDAARDAGGGWVLIPRRNSGKTLIDEKLVIHSNTTLMGEAGVEILLAPGSDCQMISNAANGTTGSGALDGAVTAGSQAVTSAGFTADNVGDPFTIWGAGVDYGPLTGTVTGVGTGSLAHSRQVTDAVITNGDNFITSATADFTWKDVGRIVAHANLPVGTRIVGIHSPDSVALSAAATGTASGATVTITGATATNAVTGGGYGYVAIGERDENILVMGITWNPQSNNGSFGDGYYQQFIRCDRLTVAGCRYVGGRYNGNANYAVNTADCNDVVIEDLDLNVPRDGVHINGPARGVRISNIRGSTGDDMVALDIGNYVAYRDTIGPVDDVTVENIFPEHTQSGVAMFGDSTIFEMSRIKIRNFLGRLSSDGSIIRISHDAGLMPNGLTLNDVTISGINVAGAGEILLGARLIRDIVIEDLVHTSAFNSINVNYGVVESLTVRGFRAVSTTGQLVIVSAGAQLDTLLCSDVAVTLTGTARFFQNESVNPTLVAIDNFDIKGSAADEGWLFYQGSGKGSVKLILGNGRLKHLKRILRLDGTLPVELHLNGAILDTNTKLAEMAATAVLRVVAGAVTQVAASDQTLDKTAGATFSAAGPLFKTDLAKVDASAALDGDTFWNTNAGASLGIGQVIRNTGAWTSLAALTATVAGKQAYPTHAEVAYPTPPKAQTNWTAYVQSSSRHLAGERNSSGAQNAEITYELQLQAGTYTLALTHTKSADAGIFSIYINGVLHGTTVDSYNASTAAGRTEVAGITVPASGAVEIRLVMADKNASSSSYVGRLNMLSMTRTGA